MPDAVFPFPGGKSRLASWILEYVPEHTCFVGVFGGAAGVLVNEDPEASSGEVYNDRDGDLVQFFEVLRERPDELVEWLETVPYSRAVHSEWVEAFYNGYRPSDSVERAGQFFYLRYAQWGGKYASNSGFVTSKVNNQAQGYANKIDRLEEFAARFDDVVLENLEWSEVFEKYDGPETVFYCGPPYVGRGTIPSRQSSTRRSSRRWVSWRRTGWCRTRSYRTGWRSIGLWVVVSGTSWEREERECEADAGASGDELLKLEQNKESVMRGDGRWVTNLVLLFEVFFEAPRFQRVEQGFLQSPLRVEQERHCLSASP